jgi:hypothetical protein
MRARRDEGGALRVEVTMPPQSIAAMEMAL